MAYLGKTPSQAVRSRYYFTASGGETSLSGTDDNSNTLTFTDGNYVDVSLNGVALVAGSDYNTTTANTIGGLSALTASDVVEVVVYDTFSVFSGNVNSDFSVGGDLTITGTTTTSGNINFGDNDKAVFGAGSDLQVFHDATDSHVVTTNGDLNLQVAGAGTINLGDQFGNTLLKVVDNADVKLYHGSSPALKLATTSTGIDVTGTVTADGLTVDGDASLNGTAVNFIFNETDTTDLNTRLRQSGALFSVATVNDSGSSPKAHIVVNNSLGDISFYDSTGTTQGLYWDASTQRLGLGTTGPGAGLEVEDSNGVIVSRSGYSQYLQLQPANNSVPTILGEGGNGVHLGPTSTTGIRVDSSGNVGIGIAAPTEDLHIKGQDGAHADVIIQAYTGYNSGLNFNDNAGMAGRVYYNHSSNFMAFDTNGSEAARIDSSGNLHVGKTASGLSTAGLSLRGDVDVAQFTRDGNDPLNLNRLSTQGSIVGFYYDSTLFGQIGVNSSDNLYFSTANTGFKIADDELAIIPANSDGTNSDNDTDLGMSAVRFDDIFATNGTIQTSDENEKNTITDSDLGLDFINRLAPKSYVFNGKTRTHYGLIAQDVETVLGDISKPTSGFAGFIKSDISEEQDGSEYRYGLRYTEFVGPLIKALQEADAKIEALETSNADLIARIETLENAE